ncbi:hypothetical protein ACHAWF_006570 [Thalassiosira exigua]
MSGKGIFVYGKNDEHIPLGALHVRVHPSVEEIFPRVIHGNVVSVELQEGVKKIHGHALEGCRIERINLPKSVEEIGAYAFRAFYRLTELRLPEGRIYVGANAFSECYSLGSARIPSSLECLPVAAFSDCRELREVAFPDGGGESSLEKIGASAFLRCKSLQRIKLPPTVEEVSAGAFWGCANLTEVDLSSSRMKRVGMFAFYKCASLESIAISSTVDDVGKRAFYSCTKFGSIFEGLRGRGRKYTSGSGHSSNASHWRAFEFLLLWQRLVWTRSSTAES